MEMKSLTGLILLGGIVLMGIFSMQILPLVNIDQEITYAVDEVDLIQMDVDVTPVHVIQVDAGEKIRFHLYGKASQQIELVGNVDGKVADVFIDYPTAFHGPTRLHLDVYLPADYEKDLDIRITTGSVKLDSMNLTHFTLDTTTGGMEADNLNAEEVKVYTTTGSVRFNTLNADTVDVKGSTGSVSMDVCNAASTVIKTTTGSIKVNQGSGNFNLQASTGGVRLTMSELLENTLNLKTTTGSINLTLPEEAAFSLKAENTTGSINADFPLTYLTKHKAQAETGEGTANIQLNASTGSISVQK
jgi:DUF4097 and DUF4098 domain-containing protein YvlB